MSSDVVLTAALRNNLLSLQRTQGLIDKAQLRLATGLKVNSALDNPQNFFASQGLKNRASDLNRLLDGIGQNIQVIKAADNGISALTKLVEQADSVVSSARDVISQGTSEAKITGDKDLSGIADLTQLSGIFDATNTTTVDQLVISVVDPDTDSLVDFDEATPLPAQENLTIDIYAGDSIEELITRINDNNNIAEKVIEAELDANGNLQFRTLNGGDFSIEFRAQAGAGTANDHLALGEALGFGQIGRLNGDGAAADNFRVTASADTVLKSFSLYESGSAGADVAERSDLLEALEDENSNILFQNLDAAGDSFTISVDGATTQTISLNNLSIQGFIDAINTNASLNTLIEADFDDENGQITIRSIDPTVQDVTIGAYGDAGTEDINFGFGTTVFDAAALAAATTVNSSLEETIRFGAAAGRLAELEIEYNNVRSQIDELVSNGDTGYRGTNLLFGDNLTTFFNEFRSSSLDTEGVTFNSAGLGLNNARFTDAASINATGDETRAALESVRSFGTTLANDLAIIQTRENFTGDLINTLNEGSDKLTVADQNEEGAKLLSLQTRQQLGVTSLSLASQSQQSILRLF